MNQHRSLLAWFVVLFVGVVLWGGCATGGGASGTPGDDGGPTDGTTPVTDASDGGDAAACSGGKTKCGGVCTSTANDPKNCGKCGLACPSGEVCTMGSCAAGCSAGETLCGGATAPEAGAGDDGGGVESGASEAGTSGGTEGGTASEGGAGASDAAGATGDDGGGTDSGATSGDGGASAPYCANLNDDPSNCGGCGISCGLNGVCTNGSCSLQCPSGQKGCPASGTCIPDNTCCQSGECTITGEVCPMPGGTCSCPAGERECAGTLMSCISTSACCTDSDCNQGGVTGQKCTTPGQPCACAAGLQCCVAADCPNAPHVASDSCTANKCGIVKCDQGCYDLDSQFADGCECCDSVYGKSCGAATAGGALTVGGAAVTYSGSIPEVGGSSVGDWFSVTFTGETNTAFHANIQLTAGAGEFVFDLVQSSCGGANLNCGEGGACTSKTQWEESYSGPSPAADPNSKTPGGVSNFTPIPAVGTVFIHVYRASASAAATCNQYKLVIQE